jgi:hypothetical protein
MQDNFDLKGYLRNDNKLLNESMAFYTDLKPINELEGQKPPFGMPETYSMGLWKCYYDYPGILVWSYDDVPFDELVVYATPGWDADGTTPVQVDVDGVTKDMTEVDGSRFASFQEYAQAMKVVLDAVEEEYVTKKGMKEGDQYDGVYDGHSGPAITSELEKPEKIYADDTDRYDANYDRIFDLGGDQIEQGIISLLDDGFEPEDIIEFCKIVIEDQALRAQEK